MLSIEYIKQIDELLEVEGFKIDLFDGIKYFMFEFPNGERWSIMGNETFDYVNNWKDVFYPLYLVRVCEAMGVVAHSDKERESLISSYFSKDEEVWQDIPGFKGLYQASTLGDIRRINDISVKGATGDNKILSKTIDIQGYYRSTLSKNNKRHFCLTSRLIAMTFFTDYHEYKEVDHKDRNPLNNHISNLRMASRSLNGSNTKKRKGGSSKYKGVHFHKRSGKWISKLTHNKKQYNLGYYENEEEAGRAYDKKVLELNGDFGTTNEGLGLFMDHIKEKV